MIVIFDNSHSGEFMGKIFRNQNEIPVPSFAYVNASDARVFTMHRDEQNKRRRITIGRATSRSTMYPNENFKFLYPKLWAEYYGDEKLLPHELHVGLYGLLLSSAWQSNLYPLLQNDFGAVHANAILDYAMYSIRFRANSTDLMKDELSRQLTFSDKLKSDSWYSEFFEKQMTADLIHKFRIDWLKHCAAEEQTEAWLCIDGSNNDCTVYESNLAEPGKAKSLKNINIYSYMWAVSSKDGRPITWFVNNGGKVDAKAFEKMIKFLKEGDIKVKGVILDRGFANEEVLSLIRKLKYNYVVMLKSSALAYKKMLEKYAETIRWKVSHVINDKGIFGVAERMKVFATGTETACVGLFYDCVRGGKSALNDIAQALDAVNVVKAQIGAGKLKSALRIPAGMKNFVTLSGTEDKPKVALCVDELQKAVDGRGFNAIASSEDLTADEISQIYDLRDVSEKQFSVLKSQLGCDVTRVHTDQRIEAKLAVGFITAIIRTEIELKCRKLGLDANKMLRETDRTVLTLMPSEQYCAVHDCSKRIRDLYSEFGLSDEHLDYFAQEVNNRRNPMHSEARSMPPFETPKSKRGPGRSTTPKTEEPEVEPKEKRRPGRPAGSKNKKTLEREAMEATLPPKPKRGPGRPKGSKNKKTLEREALEAAREAEALKPKRSRGRPVGSKNKKTLEREALEAARQEETVKSKHEAGHKERYERAAAKEEVQKTTSQSGRNV